MTALRSREPSETDEFLRALGFSCAAAVGASVIGLIASLTIESENLLKWSLGTLAVSIIVPYVAMRWHMAATESLTQGQKRTWRHVSGWGGFGFIASFFYLMRSDRRLRP